MKYYVYDTYDNTTTGPKEFDDRASVRTFIDARLNEEPGGRLIETITVVQGTKLLLETRKVTIEETMIIGGSD